MECQLAKVHTLIENDKKTITSHWIDHLPPQDALELLARSEEHSPSRTPRKSIGTHGLGSCASTYSGSQYSRRRRSYESDTDGHRSKRRRRGRRRRSSAIAGMDESDAISVGSSSRILTNRPILEPTPPSSRRAVRTPSPTRKLLTQLESARPPLKCCQPGNSFGTLPDPVVALRRCLAKDLGKACVPRDLEQRLRAAAPDELEDAGDEIFSDIFIPTEDLEAHWDKIQAAYIEAERCQNSHKDENAWVEVVRAVFRAAGLATHTSALEINSVQNQQIKAEFLPILPTTVTPLVKKADLAFAFSPHNDARVRDTLQWVSEVRPGVSFSHMADAYTSTLPLVSGIEVKEPGGDYNEAILQLAVWSAAGLEKVRQLGGRANDSNLAQSEPFIGWTVVGHEWRLHIAWKEPTGRVVVMGPWSSMKAGTASYIELFVLIDLIRRVSKWLLNVYWPWLNEEMLRQLYSS